MHSCTKEELLGGTPQENAKLVLDVISGNGTAAQNTAVALNAGACIYVAEKGISFADAVKKAEEVMKSGKAKDILDGFIKVTNNG